MPDDSKNIARRYIEKQKSLVEEERRKQKDLHDRKLAAIASAKSRFEAYRQDFNSINHHLCLKHTALGYVARTMDPETTIARGAVVWIGRALYFLHTYKKVWLSNAALAAYRKYQAALNRCDGDNLPNGVVEQCVEMALAADVVHLITAQPTNVLWDMGETGLPDTWLAHVQDDGSYFLPRLRAQPICSDQAEHLCEHVAQILEPYIVLDPE